MSSNFHTNLPPPFHVDFSSALSGGSNPLNSAPSTSNAANAANAQIKNLITGAHKPSILYALAVYDKPVSFLNGLNLLPEQWLTAFDSDPLFSFNLSQKNFQQMGEAYQLFAQNQNQSQSKKTEKIEYPTFIDVNNLPKALNQVSFFLKSCETDLDLVHLRQKIAETSLLIHEEIMMDAAIDDQADNHLITAFIAQKDYQKLSNLSALKTDMIIHMMRYYQTILSKREQQNDLLATQMVLTKDSLGEGAEYSWNNHLQQAIYQMLEVGLHHYTEDNPFYQNYHLESFEDHSALTSLNTPIWCKDSEDAFQKNMAASKAIYATDIFAMDAHLMHAIYEICTQNCLYEPSFFQSNQDAHHICQKIFEDVKLYLATANQAEQKKLKAEMIARVLKLQF